MNEVVLSLFPGVGLLDKAFESEGFCVVRGPDLIFGGDIRSFRVPAGTFDGVIGGPPCQDFSSLRRDDPTGYGLEMLDEYQRVVSEALPEWWLMENVSQVPDVKIDGYSWQRFDINQGWYSDVRRLRHIQYGSLSGRVLYVERGQMEGKKSACAIASDSRSFSQLCDLQGLPSGFDIPAFTVGAKKRAVGNGVPLVMGRELARACRSAVTPRSQKLCACGCGRPVDGKAKYGSPACRKREQRRRDSAAPKKM